MPIHLVAYTERTSVPPPLAGSWYKSYIIKGKVHTMIFLKTVLKKHFVYCQLFVGVITKVAIKVPSKHIFLLVLNK